MSKNKKKQSKSKPSKVDLDSSHDELYKIYLLEKKKKQAIDKKRLASIRNVKVSTPVQRQQRKSKKTKTNLEFGVSPIRLDQSVIDSLENVDSTKALLDSIRKQRLKEIEERQKELESSATRAAKQLLAEYKNKRPLQSSENIPVVQQDLNFEDASEPSESPERSLVIHKRRTRSSFGRNLKDEDDVDKVHSTIYKRSTKSSIELKHSGADDNTKALSKLSIPIIQMTSPKVSDESEDNSLQLPSQSFSLMSPNIDSIELPSDIIPDNSPLMALTRSRKRKSRDELSTTMTKMNLMEVIKESETNDCDKTKEEPAIPTKIKKSVAINLVPAIQEIIYHDVPTVTKRKRGVKKSVGFALLPIKSAPTESTISENPTLKPGKWRRSLVEWRTSHGNSTTLRNTTSRGTSMFFEASRKASSISKPRKTFDECEYSFVIFSL